MREQESGAFGISLDATGPFDSTATAEGTVGGGDVSAYAGTKDIVFMPSVVDVAGINRISAQIYVNAAGAIAGMVQAAPARLAGNRAARKTGPAPGALRVSSRPGGTKSGSVGTSGSPSPTPRTTAWPSGVLWRAWGP